MRNILKLLTIVALGVLIGGGVYAIYKKSTKITPQFVKEKVSEPITSKSTTKPETPSSKANFSKRGHLSVQEDGSLVLVWDEPGKLALNVRLKFTDQTICILSGEKQDCGQINREPENYDYVSVEGSRNDGEVTVTKLEELKAPL